MVNAAAGLPVRGGAWSLVTVAPPGGREELGHPPPPPPPQSELGRIPVQPSLGPSPTQSGPSADLVPSQSHPNPSLPCPSPSQSFPLPPSTSPSHPSLFHSLLVPSQSLTFPLSLSQSVPLPPRLLPVLSQSVPLPPHLVPVSPSPAHQGLKHFNHKNRALCGGTYKNGVGEGGVRGPGQAPRTRVRSRWGGPPDGGCRREPPQRRWVQ